MTARLSLEEVSRDWLRRVSLEDMLVHPLLFGLQTATPVQRAVCRVADGRPLGELARDPDVLEALGGSAPEILERPKEVAVIAGIRTFKSGIAACMGAHASQQCDLEGVRRGDIVRVSLVSTKLENARALYGHIAGAFCQSPALKRRLISDPGNSSDHFVVAHHTGFPIEIGTVAGQRAGASLVSVWQAACVFDEYSRMTGDASDGVVNWKEQRAAVYQRIRPKGYLAHITSPYGEFGPAYDHAIKDHGRPSSRLVVFRAKAPQMNPVYWTAERCAEAQAHDPESYRTDVLAEFATPETNLIPGEHLRRCVREDRDDLSFDPRFQYFATMDPATRGNGWTIGVWVRDGRRRTMVAAREERGSPGNPLDPRDMFERVIAPLCKTYRIASIQTDGWGGDALAAIARDFGIGLLVQTYSGEEKTRRYYNLRTGISQGLLQLPGVPELQTDLLRLKKRVTPQGVVIVLPLTKDGRHCDWAPVVMLAAGDYVEPYVDPSARDRSERDRMLEAAIRHYGRDNDDD